MEDKFIVIAWPDIQDLMDKTGFDNNSLLINDGKLYEEYGDSAYMVRESWLDASNDNELNKLENQTYEG